MKLFVDTADLGEIEALAPLGIIDGVTTNPSLLAKVGNDPRGVLKGICELVKGPVSAEVVATDCDGMVREGRELAAIDSHIVVKVPFGKAGVQACRILANEGVRVNVTLIFSASQALLAAKGYEVELAHDGLHVLEMLSEGEIPDLVLLDLSMPELDGEEVLRRLRADERLRDLPVLLATASEIDLDTMPRVAGFLRKPYSREVLFAMLKTLLMSES